MFYIWTWTNICFSRPLSDSNSQLSGRKIDYCPTILNWDRQISPRLLDIEDSQRHNLLLADKMLIWETHMSWLTLLWLYITQIHGNLGASWRWVSEHRGWDLKKGKNAFILWVSERVQGQGVLGCYSFTHTSQEDDKTPEDEWRGVREPKRKQPLKWSSIQPPLVGITCLI